MQVTRRQVLATAAATAAVSAIETTGAGSAQAANPLSVLKYKLVVPEVFQAPPSLPSHSPVLVLGTGFGASVTALRLARSGVAVRMLERGSRWPVSNWRDTFANDTLPDGRAFWFRNSFTGVTGLPVFTDSFGGVLDVTDFPGIQVWRGAGVGGGSLVFTGALVRPEDRFFSHVFGNTVTSAEMNNYYARALSMLRGSTMPSDVYNSAPFGHSRQWDVHATRAGYTPQKINSIFNWDVVRKELRGSARKSATIGESNYGNSNGAKYDLTQNYLKDAEATRRVTVHHHHEVQAIGQQADGRYWVRVNLMDPTGSVRKQMTVTCDRLFLGAGSVGTSELLVRARAEGTLPNLNEHIGQGWGTNGDAALAQTFSPSGGFTQGSPSASRILDESGMPVTLENWYVPGLPINAGIIGSLGMTLDDRRASFGWRNGQLTLDWPRSGMDESIAAMRRVHDKIASANHVPAGFGPLIPDINAKFTAHPLGGAVLGKATDGYGRVVGHPGLYVMDGAAIPGSTGTVNPSLTITALAERNIERIIRDGQ